jgi:hypothetical protein
MQCFGFACLQGDAFLQQLCVACMSQSPQARPSFESIVHLMEAHYSGSAWQQALLDCNAGPQYKQQEQRAQPELLTNTAMQQGEAQVEQLSAPPGGPASPEVAMEQQAPGEEALQAPGSTPQGTSGAGMRRLVGHPPPAKQQRLGE